MEARAGFQAQESAALERGERPACLGTSLLRSLCLVVLAGGGLGDVFVEGREFYKVNIEFYIDPSGCCVVFGSEGLRTQRGC